jgi:hypothetical protein
MKKLYLLFVPLFIATVVGSYMLSSRPVAADGNHKSSIVGAWDVQAVGAPYEPHLFTFNSDGTMLTTNPTNVQEDPSAPNGGTNDSVGMGPWEPVGHNEFVGTFYQLNANVNDHTPADTLSVTYRIKVTGDTFTGDAIAKLGPFTAPAQLFGTRLQIDEAALEDL